MDKTAIPVDVFVVPECFTTFPVAVHKDEPIIARGMETAREAFRRAGVPNIGKTPSGVGPLGNFFAFYWPEADVKRVELMAEIMELLWVYDDVIEALPHDEALREHKNVLQILDNNDKTSKSVLSSVFQGLTERITEVDAAEAPRMITGLKKYFTEYDSSNTLYTDIASYAQYRDLSIGAVAMEAATRFCLYQSLSDAETAEFPAYKDFYAASARALALTNDYYSWGKEKNEPTDRPRNAVPVIMTQYGMSEADAKTFLKGMVVEAEQATRRTGLELKRQAAGSAPGEKVALYVEAMIYMLAGNAFWSSNCPRYNPEMYQ